MRINVVIDDELMARAMQHTGLKTKKAVIEEALRTLIHLKSNRSFCILTRRMSRYCWK